MTADRPWASGPCMAGRPDDCPRVHPVDGRRCINPLHTAYPDDLGAGEQPTLDAPDLVDTLEGDGDPHDALADAANTVTTRRRRWTCDRCGNLVIRAEHVTGTRKEPTYACDQPAEPVHNHEWAPMPDPHGLYNGKAYLCYCGASMDDLAVYPFGDTPGPTLADAAVAGGAWGSVTLDPSLPPNVFELRDGDDVQFRGFIDTTSREDMVRRLVERADAELTAGVVEALRSLGWACWKREDGEPPYGAPTDDPTGLPPIELTAGEVKRIIGAHTVLRHTTALDVVREILDERRIYPNGKP